MDLLEKGMVIMDTWHQDRKPRNCFWQYSSENRRGMNASSDRSVKELAGGQKKTVVKLLAALILVFGVTSFLPSVFSVFSIGNLGTVEV